MADNELDTSIIKATQQALGKYVKKPPLTEKLLKKPPFRFLLDVFNAFIRETGCFAGLYAPDEQLFENIHDRDDKMRFLQKMIDVVKLTTQKDLKVRTSKIVAGHEPEHTNALLQSMASVAEQHLSWRSAVDQVLSSGAVVEGKAKTAMKSKETKSRENRAMPKNISPTGKQDERSKRSSLEQRKEKRISPQEQKLRKAIDQTASKMDKHMDRDKEKAARKQKSDSKPMSRQSSKQKSPSPVKVETKAKQQTSTDSEAISASPVPAPLKLENKGKANEQVELNTQTEAPTAELSNKQPQPEPTQLPSAAAPGEQTKEPESRRSSGQRRSSGSSSKSRRSSASQRQQAEPDTTEPLHTIREIHQQPVPLSASTSLADSNSNGSGNSVKNNAELKRENTFTRENSRDSNSSLTQRPRTSLRPPSARPASARPGAPRRRDRNVEIVLQPNDQIKMSGISVKLENFGDFDDDGENLVIIEDANAHDIDAGMTAQTTGTDAAKELESGQGHLVQQILETQKELVHQNTEANGIAAKEEQLNNLGARQSSARQMNGLRDIIQNLTKSVNPLGKLMDYIPEDIDAMQLELSMWRDAYTQAMTELKRERNLTDSAIEPMKQQLVQIEASIDEYQELVEASQHKILLNNERILKMLTEQ